MCFALGNLDRVRGVTPERCGQIMEDEIDLRAYLDVLLRRWKWIVGVTLVAALAAGAVSFATPAPPLTYESTASVFVQPQVLVLLYFHVASFQV